MKQVKKKIIPRQKKKLASPPVKKVNMGGGPFVGRHTTG